MPSKIKENSKEIKKDKKKTSKKKLVTSSTPKKSVAKKTNTKKNNKKTSEKKVTSNKKTSSKLVSKKTSTTKKVTNIKPIVEVVEYYDLPYRYNETLVKILYQTPNTLFVYWDISDTDRENYIKQYGDNFFNITRPVLIIHNDTKNYIFFVCVLYIGTL